MGIIRISLLLFWSSCAALIAQPSEQLYQLLHLDELVEIVSEEGLADANATADAYLQGVTRGGFGASIAKIYDKNSLSSRVKDKQVCPALCCIFNESCSDWVVYCWVCANHNNTI